MSMGSCGTTRKHTATPIARSPVHGCALAFSMLLPRQRASYMPSIFFGGWQADFPRPVPSWENVIIFSPRNRFPSRLGICATARNSRLNQHPHRSLAFLLKDRSVVLRTVSARRRFAVGALCGESEQPTASSTRMRHIS